MAEKEEYAAQFSEFFFFLPLLVYGVWARAQPHSAFTQLFPPLAMEAPLASSRASTI
jgi:hypothetical protein